MTRKFFFLPVRVFAETPLALINILLGAGFTLSEMAICHLCVLVKLCERLNNMAFETGFLVHSQTLEVSVNESTILFKKVCSYRLAHSQELEILEAT